MTRDHAIDAADASGGEPPPPDPIDAELADHLALVEREIVFSGARADEANGLARQRFGDVNRVRRQCQWVQEGDAIMLRYTMIAALTAISIALAITAWSSWRGQQQLASQLRSVSEELSSQRESMRDAIAEMERVKAPAPTTGSISGYAYLGDEGTPAAGAKLQLLKRLPSDREWEIEREVTLGEVGKFEFTALTPAIYSVFAHLVPRAGVENGKRVAFIQTEPKSIQPGDIVGDQAIDLGLHAGYVRIGLSKPAPDPLKITTSQETVELTLGVLGRVFFDNKGSPRKNISRSFSRPQRLFGPWTPAISSEPDQWPLVHPYSWDDSFFPDLPRGNAAVFREDAMLYTAYGSSLVESPAPWLAGEYTGEFAMALKGFENGLLTGIRASDAAQAARPGGRGGFAGFVPNRQSLELSEINGVPVTEKQRLIHFEVREGEVTDLVVQVPDNLNDLRATLDGLLEGSAVAQQSRFFAHDIVSSQEDYEHLMDIVLRWFDVKVVGPRPLAEVEAEIAAAADADPAADASEQQSAE